MRRGKEEEGGGRKRRKEEWEQHKAEPTLGVRNKQSHVLMLVGQLICRIIAYLPCPMWCPCGAPVVLLSCPCGLHVVRLDTHLDKGQLVQEPDDEAPGQDAP